jgi:hypothetical protein
VRERRSTSPQFVVPTPAPSPDGRRALLARDPTTNALSPILDPTRNHWLYRRPIDERLSAECATIAAQSAFRREHLVPTDAPTIDPLVDSRFGAELRAFLAEDIARWVRAFGALASIPRCKITLASVWTDSCRKFHADFVELRLLCTYAGPATQFVSDEFVSRDVELDTSRSLEAIAQANAQMITDAERVRCANTGDVLVLKGELWPHNRGRGAIHRSPPIEGTGTRRLVLTIDAPNPALGEHVH